MRIHRAVTESLLCLWLCVSMSGVALAAEFKHKAPANRNAKQDSSKGDTSKAPARYKPPHVGAPKVSAAGGTRGPDGKLPQPLILLPEHTGLTVRAAPSIYWSLSGPTDARIKITLDRHDAEDPWFAINLVGSKPAGIHQLDLAAHGVVLEPNVEYEIHVELVVGSHPTSRDPYAKGNIRRIKPSGTLAAAPKGLAPADAASTLAEHGIWFDALSALTDQISARPDDQALRSARAGLLRLVGFKVTVVKGSDNGFVETIALPPNGPTK